MVNGSVSNSVAVTQEHLVFVETILWAKDSWETPFLCDITSEPNARRYHHAQHRAKMQRYAETYNQIVSITTTSNLTHAELAEQLVRRQCLSLTTIAASKDRIHRFWAPGSREFECEIAWKGQKSRFDNYLMRTELRNDKNIAHFPTKMKQRGRSDRFVLKLI